jgi:modification methylase
LIATARQMGKPLALPSRLVQMFSFVGDTVLDPFCDTGTTMVAALQTRRNGIGIELDTEYRRIGVISNQ